MNTNTITAEEIEAAIEAHLTALEAKLNELETLGMVPPSGDTWVTTSIKGIQVGYRLHIDDDGGVEMDMDATVESILEEWDTLVARSEGIEAAEAE